MGVVHKIRNPKYQKSFIMKKNIFSTLLIPRLFSRLLKSLRRCGRKLMSGIIEFPLIFWTEILLIFPREILLIFPTEILLASPAKFAFTVTRPWWFKTNADAILKKKYRRYAHFLYGGGLNSFHILPGSFSDAKVLLVPTHVSPSSVIF